MVEKKPLNQIIGKTAVTKEGKKLGKVKDITFETRTGELIHLILTEPTVYLKNLGIEKSKGKDIIIPYSAILAIGDFVVVAEEDIV